MAGQDVTKVRVALAGNIWVADTGATVPTDITVTPNASWTDLGYTDEDGITFSMEQETEDIMGWQALEPLRTVVTTEPKQFSFVLRQLERSTWLTAFGGSVTGSSANWKWVPPTAGAQAYKMFLLEFLDGSLKYRLCYRNCVQQGEREINFVRENAVNLPLEYKVLAAQPQTWEMYTNDNSFSA